ncbi:MAG: hypothetical protein IPK99_11060 [Flavobacteriales bacterium]|nr:hypothetical protein [Flavobacteriales bacterium]
MYPFQKAISNTLAAACLLPFGGAVAQQVEDHWWIPNNTVNAVALDSATGTVYLGGDFTTVTSPLRYGAALTLLPGYRK